MSQTRIFRGVETKIFHHDHDSIVLPDGTGSPTEQWTLGSYRDTVVVKWSRRYLVLNSGGWRSATTKLRMNQAANQFSLGYQVYQENFDWYVYYNTLFLKPLDASSVAKDTVVENSARVDFHDNLIFQRI